MSKSSGSSGGNTEDRKEGKKKKTRKRTKSTRAVDHTLAARWVQEQILTELPELGYVPESLIERILKTAHRYYIEQGYKTIRLADK